MASVIREVFIEAPEECCWDLLGDFAEGPQRFAPGYVTGSLLTEPGERLVTFTTGDVVRERLIAIDDQARRIVWAWVGDAVQPIHNNSSMQVFAHGPDRSRLVWVHDVLPDELVTGLAAAMDGGLPVIKQTLEAHANQQLGQIVPGPAPAKQEPAPLGY
ncbi:SRPBCC family protein [Streptomyces sp. NPDC015345]|uniref:SRPBCC family protein n=1 Tax=Streptomyces sp. NPDC015345 TaxID=3364953 RepID=UPI003703514E